MNDRAFRPALETALSSALDHLHRLETDSVAPTATRDELGRQLGKPLADEPLPPDQVIRELVEDTRGGIVGMAGSRFFAWAVGGSVPAALAADWLTSAWDQNAVLYASGPAASVVEEVAGEWLKDLLRLPGACSVGFVSGCQMAHATCLAAARHELLQARGWDVERNGLAGTPQIRVLASNRHGSIERAARLLGIGADNVVDLALDETERARPASLEAALKEAGTRP